MLYLHSGRDIDKATAAEHSAVQSTEPIIIGRQRFASEDLVRIFAELAYPVRLDLHIDDIVDGLLRQAHTGIARRFEIIEKVADIAINIDRSCRVAHCLSSW